MRSLSHLDHPSLDIPDDETVQETRRVVTHLEKKPAVRQPPKLSQSRILPCLGVGRQRQDHKVVSRAHLSSHLVQPFGGRQVGMESGWHVEAGNKGVQPLQRSWLGSGHGLAC